MLMLIYTVRILYRDGVFAFLAPFNQSWCYSSPSTQSVSSSPVNPDTCPGEEDWFDLPPDIKIDLHVVARGNSNDLRTTLTSLGWACYPEVS